jgi:hypothetical protein
MVSLHNYYLSTILELEFGSGHGKGVHDGIRAILKHEIKKKKLRLAKSFKMLLLFVSRNNWRNLQPTLMHEGWCDNFSIW